ncbi:MAG: hypothetical protein R3Y27_04830 [Clostridia bacterium]
MNSFDLMVERYKQEMREFDNKVNASQIRHEQREEKAANELETPPFDGFREVSEANDVPPKQEDLIELVELDNEILPVMAIMQNDDPIDFDGEGTLVIQAFMASEAYPIVSAMVRVSESGDEAVIFEGLTDVNGKTEPIVLSAPSADLSQQPMNIAPYALYDVSVSQAKYKPRKYIDVPVFDGVESIQPVQLVPVDSSSTAEDVVVTRAYDLGGEADG